MSAKFKTIQPSAMTKDQFVTTLADIYEHSPWVAEQSFDTGILEEHDIIENLAALMAKTMLAASSDKQLELIKAHPDLAGRAAMRGELTESSTKEQAGVGLDQCSPEEMEKFTNYNDQYKAKFGFPFIIAVTGLNRHIILEAFETRLKNNHDEEFQTALAQINRIAKIRLSQL
ncbi:MAG: 2-oxo-4-hydroxy-4-carboxy-5-ureidoimidazoline decarboxylase [Alphaproteobacteria bacterium]|nr:2-oxo-4-hydroxy-4-carboxy-5-ureidoimidazoline decarboxylase [Alphaproteobacteria bacterium]